MCAYYSQYAHTQIAPRSQKQWDAFKFCRAVKSARINGHLTFPWKAKPEVINQSNVARAREIFGIFIRMSLEQLGLKSAVLIPVPSKDGLVEAQSFRSLVMVQEAMAKQTFNATIAPILRFNQQLTSAHAGGLRGREVIRPYLTLVRSPPAGPVILIDDIITSGGSLLASYDVLAAHDIKAVGAVICGHTVNDSLTAAFGHHEKTIDPSAEIAF
jgi:predicted amidophosphoribosyltransferase